MRAGPIAVALSLVALLGGCSKDAKAISNAKAAVAARLRDPQSARFTDVFVSTSRRAEGHTYPAVCGTVDGKNLYGAYTGGTRFAVATGPDGEPIEVTLDEGTNRVAVPDGRESIFERVWWNTSCMDGKHPRTETGQPLG